jgi:hypothetical protein
MAGFLSVRLAAQTSVPPKKFVFVESVGSDPPPAAQSSIFVAPAAVAIGPWASTGSFAAAFYVADPLNNQVVVFPPGSPAAPIFLKSFTCPSIVGGCMGPLSSPWTLSQPTYVAVDPNTGNLWISDTGNDVVVEVDPTSSTVVAFAGVGPHIGNTVCTTSQTFFQPAIPDNTAFVNLFNPTCTMPRINEGQGPGAFLTPGPVAVDISGNVYVVDGVGQNFLGPPLCLPAGPNCAFPVPPAANFRVEKFSSSGRFLTSFGGPGTAAGQFGEVAGIAVDNSSNVYLADACNNRVEKFNSNGTFLLQWGSPVPATGCLMPVPPSSLNFTDGMLNVPGGIAVDSIDQSVYVVDQGSARIQQFDGSGTFLSKGGSNGEFEAQFNMPYAIATVPPSLFLIACELAGDSDCAHGLVVSELSVPTTALVTSSLGGGCFPTTDANCAGGSNLRVQFLAARPDQDNDGITDEIDLQPTTFSNDFSNGSLGFTTSGSILQRGDQTFVIYNLLSPTPADIARLGSSACNSTGCNEIRVRTETFGGPAPLILTKICAATTMTLSFPAGTGQNIHCSTPTLFTEEGPVGFSFVGGDGTVATATLNTGDSLSVDPSTSKITSNAGTIAVVVGGKTVSLSPGQSTFADTTPPRVSCGSADSVWHALDVSITCTAADIGSGLASPFDANFALSTSVPAGTETANAATGTRLVCDLAGNCTTAGPVPANMIDKKAPTINVTTPIRGATYSANQAVSAAYTCTDLGSGVATCSGTVPNGSTIDTAPNGVSTPKTFTVNAADKVGNVASQSVGYMVSCHYVSLGISPSTVTRGKPITITAAVQSCANSSQTVSLQFTLTGPLGPFPSCTNNSSRVMFTTPAFTIPAGTSLTKSFRFHIPRTVCPGNFTITSTTLAGGTPIDTASAPLVIQRHHREDDDNSEPERTDRREDDGEPE